MCVGGVLLLNLYPSFPPLRAHTTGSYFFFPFTAITLSGQVGSRDCDLPKVTHRASISDRLRLLGPIPTLYSILK